MAHLIDQFSGTAKRLLLAHLAERLSRHQSVHEVCIHCMRRSLERSKRDGAPGFALLHFGDRGRTQVRTACQLLHLHAEGLADRSNPASSWLWAAFETIERGKLLLELPQ